MAACRADGICFVSCIGCPTAILVMSAVANMCAEQDFYSIKLHSCIQVIISLFDKCQVGLPCWPEGPKARGIWGCDRGGINGKAVEDALKTSLSLPRGAAPSWESPNGLFWMSMDCVEMLKSRALRRGLSPLIAAVAFLLAQLTVRFSSSETCSALED